MVGVIALSWTARTVDDAREWDRAWAVQQDVLATAARTLPDPAPGTTILAFGVPRATRPEVPVFIGPEDLSPALRLQLRADVGGIPIQGETKVVCGREGPVTEGGFIAAQTYARYGSTVFLDYSGGRALPVPDRATCRRLAPTLQPGPLATEPEPAVDP